MKICCSKKTEIACESGEDGTARFAFRNRNEIEGGREIKTAVTFHDSNFAELKINTAT